MSAPAFALIAWWTFRVHRIAPVPLSNGRVKWVPCDFYGRVRNLGASNG